MACLADTAAFGYQAPYFLPTPTASPSSCSPASTVVQSAADAGDLAPRDKGKRSSTTGAALRRHISVDTLCDGSTAAWPPSAGAGALGFSGVADSSASSAARCLKSAGSGTPHYSKELFAACYSTLQFCWYGACSHEHCRQGLETLSPLWAALLEHLNRVQNESAALSNYIERIILLLKIKPAVLERAMDYVRRLRRKIDLNAVNSANQGAAETQTWKPLEHAKAQSLYYASRNWGTCYLVFVSACMVAQKFMEDEAGPRLGAYAAAGGFPKRALRTAERELMGMLDYELW
jgi:hypothetical protein